MADITRYVLVDRDDEEDGYEYEGHQFEEAKRDARERGCAIIARTYTYDDSELVWTPDGSDTWPPKRKPSRTR